MARFMDDAGVEERMKVRHVHRIHRNCVGKLAFYGRK